MGKNGKTLKKEEAVNELASFFEEKPKKLQREPDAKKIIDMLKSRIGQAEKWDIGPITQSELNKQQRQENLVRERSKIVGFLAITHRIERQQGALEEPRAL